MEEKIESRVAVEKVWEGWANIHSSGEKGQAGKFRYSIIDLVPNKRFTMVWKTLFVRLLFTYTLCKTQRGSEVGFDVAIKGPFAWGVRWFLEPKIRANLRNAMRMFIRKLEG